MSSFSQESSAIALLDAPLDTPAMGRPVQSRLRALAARWWVAFAASSVFVVSGHLLIKAGLNAAAANAANFNGWTQVLHSVLQWEVAAGLLIYFFGSICWMVAVAQREISFLYPLSSVNYVLVVAASYLFFADTVSPQRASGVLLIVLGMVLMNRQARSAA
jgi:drug/metabolite transporter (DMT)-like permease